MAKRYAIWNKEDYILTPVGEVFTPEQWIAKHPVAGLSHITVLCGAGEINGSFFGTLGQTVLIYEAQGADFSTCTTDEEKLEVIEAFIDEKEAEAKALAEEKALLEERQVAALEAQVMLAMPDVEEVTDTTAEA